MGFGAGKAVALGAVGAFTAFVHGSMPSAPGAPQDDAFVPRPEVAHVSAFGYDAVVSDYYWLQAVQIVGSVRDVEGKGPLLGALIDVVTTLDPWVDHPYRFAAVWLTGDLDDIRKANHLLERGIEYHPDDWRNRFCLGFNLFFYLDDYEAASAVLEEAMELPDAPLYLRRLVARLKGKAESLGLAETFLHALMLEAQSDDERFTAHLVSALASLGVGPAYQQIMGLYRAHKVDTSIIPSATARQLLLAPGPAPRLECAQHPLWERYDRHGPYPEAD